MTWQSSYISYHCCPRAYSRMYFSGVQKSQWFRVAVLLLCLQTQMNPWKLVDHILPAVSSPLSPLSSASSSPTPTPPPHQHHHHVHHAIITPSFLHSATTTTTTTTTIPTTNLSNLPYLHIDSEPQLVDTTLCREGDHHKL